MTTLRIGELATRTGVTPRTIRYYEEIGLLDGGERAKGSHRLYDDRDVERLTELTRLRDLLNLSLDELKQLFHATESSTERLRIVEAALSQIDTQLALVRRRKDELERLESELLSRRKTALARRRELSR